MAAPDLQRELPEEIAAMLRLVEPEWRLQRAQFMEDGMMAIYRVVVETGDGRRDCFLKATPLTPEAGSEPTVDTEARVTATVRRHTDIPVPRILGAVDDHDEVRTPFFSWRRCSESITEWRCCSRCPKRRWPERVDEAAVAFVRVQAPLL